MDDGTGEAQLYVYDDMVPTVLKLSGQQWHHLKDLAMRTGELLYQRQWRGGNSRPQVERQLLKAVYTYHSHVVEIHMRGALI